MKMATIKSSTVLEESSQPAWLYCNGCGRHYRKIPKISYYYYDCGHIYCLKCAGDRDYADCEICHMPQVKKIPLESNISVNDFASMSVNVVLQTPSQLIKELYRVVQFQEWHATHYIKMKSERIIHLENKNKSLVKLFEKEKEKNISITSRQNKLTVLMAKVQKKFVELMHSKKIQQAIKTRENIASINDQWKANSKYGR